jgi:tetratricopeptide (TPR) repeat protein
MARVRCIRANARFRAIPENISACAKYDDDIRREIRELTMALVIDPAYARALSERAEKYLQLGQSSNADGKPARKLFELAIKDFDRAIALDSKSHTAYCDRALALAVIGRYRDAASSYIQGMKYAKNGVEESPFVYEQLAKVYMKLGQFTEAADIATQAIVNASGAGMDTVIFGGGMKALRTLYPEYDLLPDEILAEAVRRRYEPQFPLSWDAKFASDVGIYKGKIASSELAELFLIRGDANMRAGRREDAMSDYARVKTDVWGDVEESLPRHIYFNERGVRVFNQPEPWPPPPLTM